MKSKIIPKLELSANGQPVQQPIETPSKELIKAMADSIEKNEAFKGTLSEDLSNEDWMHCYFWYDYNEADDFVKILCDFDDGTSNEREFLIFDIAECKLIEMVKHDSGMEEEERELDDDNPIREDDERHGFIISREVDNKIQREVQ